MGALIHLFYPNLKIDAITITLLLIALFPWLSPLFKSIEFPGGWKFKFREMREQLDTMIAKQTESPIKMRGHSAS
jgi:hypothetical protein